MPRYVLPIAAAFAALCAAAPSAFATSVTRTQGEAVPVVTIEDQASVADDLTLSGSQAAGVTVTSNAAKITAGPGCTQASPVVVTCAAGQVFALLGIGDDKFSSTATDLNTTVNGGRDNDTFEMSASPGSDTFLGGGAISDDGGDKDTASYAQRSTPLIVTQDGNANDGVNTTPNRPLTLGSDEHDNISADVEIVEGGRANDSLTGGPGHQDLRGNGGNDTLSGLADNDFLLGGPGNDVENGGDGPDLLGRPNESPVNDFGINDPGADTFKGGDGLDLLFTADGVKDTVIDCGTPNPIEFGGDIAHADLVDPLSVGCEQGSIAAKDQHPTVQLLSKSLRKSGGHVTVRLKCPKAAPGKACNGTAKLLRGKRTVGSSKYRIAEGASRSVSIATSASAGTIDVWTREQDVRGKGKDTHTLVQLS
jgi:Ca2+-binding RTX toxin-like protein